MIKEIWNKLFKILVFCLISTLLYSCGFYTPTSIKRRFTYCYDGKDTGLDTLLNIDGFFYVKNELNSKLVPDKSNVGYFNPSYVFHNDGFVHDNAYLLLDMKRNKWENFTENFTGASFGRYLLCNDTIKFQYVDPPGGMAQGIAEVWFKIVDKDNIRPIYWGDPDSVSANAINKFLKEGYYRNDIFTFYPMKRKIDPKKTWIYNKKWFRCKK